MKMTMKKIALAAIAVMAAFAVQAASFKWTASGTAASKTFYGADGTSTIAGLTVYLFDAATVSRDSLVTGLRGGGSIADLTSVATSTLDSNSRLTPITISSYGEVGTVYSFYMAIVSGDDVFVSATVNAAGNASATPSIAFSALRTATQTNLGNAAFSTAGWYAVPEPTSGLLALLGFAGLALRRRRA